MGPPFFKNLQNQKASALGGSVRREGVVKGVVASRNGTRTIRPRDVSRTACHVFPLALLCLALLALPPFLRLHPRCHQIDTFPRIYKPRPSSHLSPIARDSQVRTALHRPQPHMARAVHSPLLVKLSSGLHCRCKKVLTVSRTISYVFLISICNVLLSMLVMLHFPV